MNDRQARLDNLAVFALKQIQKSFLTPDVGKAERRGEVMGRLIYRLDRKHRERTHANLQLAFPEWDQGRQDRVAKEVFLHWGRMMGDFLRTPLRTNEEILANIEVEGQEHILTAMQHKKGVIACTAHFGNFERFGQWSLATGRPLTVVARDANQSAIQDEVAKLRACTGMETLSRGNSARQILAKLRQNELIGILPDQNSGESYVPFFGKLCGTVLGPAVLGARTGAMLVPSFCVRIGVGKYRVIVRPPLITEGKEKDPAGVMAEFNSVLESVIRDYPEQYLWMHDRWKSARKRGLL